MEKKTDKDWFDDKEELVIKNGIALRDIKAGELLHSYGKIL